MNLGNNISERRKSMGLTQEELAAKLGVSPQAVSKWENNLSCPDISLLPDISKLFNISVDELLGVAGTNEKTESVKEEPRSTYEPPVYNGKKATKLLIISERNGKITNIKFPLTIVRFGLNIGGIFGGPTQEQANAIEEAIKTGLAGEVISVDGENGEKVTISLI